MTRREWGGGGEGEEILGFALLVEYGTALLEPLVLVLCHLEVTEEKYKTLGKEKGK